MVSREYNPIFLCCLLKAILIQCIFTDNLLFVKFYLATLSMQWWNMEYNSFAQHFITRYRNCTKYKYNRDLSNTTRCKILWTWGKRGINSCYTYRKVDLSIFQSNQCWLTVSSERRSNYESWTTDLFQVWSLCPKILRKWNNNIIN